MKGSEVSEIQAKAVESFLSLSPKNGEDSKKTEESPGEMSLGSCVMVGSPALLSHLTPLQPHILCFLEDNEWTSITSRQEDLGAVFNSN